MAQFNVNQTLENLKNLDTNKILPLLKEHKVKAASAVIVFLSLFGLMMIYNNYQARATEYQQLEVQQQQKTEAVGKYKISVTGLQGYLKSLPQELADEKLITQLTDYAVQNNVSIVNYTPSQKKSEKFYDSSRVHLTINVKSFNDFLLFIRTIESSPYFLRVENFTLDLKESKLNESKQSESKQSERSIGGEIFITSLRLKK